MSQAVADLVIKAQTGDHQAFGELVRRFQDLAFGYALRWIGDAESARDAAQDAFVSAYLSLDQLRDPAAFPGWFRLVLLKHCDRRTRRLKPPLTESVSEFVLPDQQLLESREREWLRSAVEELPEHERIVVALHYFGDEPQQDVADLLELPLSTLKKRLHMARRRLEARRGEMEAHRPSNSSTFADKILLFLAIRGGDTETARAALARQPSLLEARESESWTVEEALEGNLPMPEGVTPLVAASARGHRAMVELLLAAGASGKESALWTAALHGYLDLVELLLAAGADPNAPNAVGHTPLHVAALRGHDQVLERLVAAGGKMDLAAANGLCARDYRQRGLEAISFDGERLESGIKAIDLFAPLTTRMLIRVQGAGGTGLMVLLAELARRFGDAGKRSIWITWEPMPWQKGELSAFVRQVGIEDCTTVLTDGLHALTDADAAFGLFVFEREGHTAEVEAALSTLARRTGPTFIVDPWATVMRAPDRRVCGRSPSGRLADASSELRAPFAARICTSRALAARGIFPAIDPERTRSSIAVDAEHRRIQEQARELLRRDDALAERARAFLAQPFTTWEQHNGRPGEVVSLRDTLAGIDAILRG